MVKTHTREFSFHKPLRVSHLLLLYHQPLTVFGGTEDPFLLFFFLTVTQALCFDECFGGVVFSWITCIFFSLVLTFYFPFLKIVLAWLPFFLSPTGSFLWRAMKGLVSVEGCGLLLLDLGLKVNDLPLQWDVSSSLLENSSVLKCFTEESVFWMFVLVCLETHCFHWDTGSPHPRWFLWTARDEQRWSRHGQTWHRERLWSAMIGRRSETTRVHHEVWKMDWRIGWGIETSHFLFQDWKL